MQPAPATQGPIERGQAHGAHGVGLLEQRLVVVNVYADGRTPKSD
jgi:hypothetical protein